MVEALSNPVLNSPFSPPESHFEIGPNGPTGQIKPGRRLKRVVHSPTCQTRVTPTIIEEQVVKSRHRVKTYGEVFTPRHMVNRMLDLVRDELEAGPHFVDKTFFEPAAGGGNFLVAILSRKLSAIEKAYQPEAWPDESLFAVASIYGIELLDDNHRDAKEAMLAEFLRFHANHHVPCGPRTNLRRAATFLIDTNIVRGDTLACVNWRSEAIELSWWNRVRNISGMVHRQPFRLASLRDDGSLDFTNYDNYSVCRIDQVHEQAKTGG